MGFTNALGIAGLKTGVVTNTGTVANPYDGQVVYETDNNDLKAYNGASWDVMNGGLVLVKTQTIGSGVSSVTVSDVFSATYDNYLVTVNGGAATANVDLKLQLGSTATGYYSFTIYGSAASNSVFGEAVNNQAFFNYFGNGDTNGLSSHAIIQNPFLAKYTGLMSTAARGNGSYYSTGGQLQNTTSYTSFTITPSTPTITGGTIRVYGYINS